MTVMFGVFQPRLVQAFEMPSRAKRASGQQAQCLPFSQFVNSGDHLTDSPSIRLLQHSTSV